MTIVVITIIFAVSDEHEARRRRPQLEETAFIELIRTVDLLSRRPAQVIKGADLSATQYNVLRILRGAPDGLSCGEIGNRMITRDPDITRLLDRLEKRALIARARDAVDRRTVITTITPAGLELLAKLDEPVQSTHREQLGHLDEKRLNQLRELLAQCRQRLE